MSAKIAAVNQTRSESEPTDRVITVSVIDVQPEQMPPPPTYEQAIITQSGIERLRIQEQQRALEELVQEQNRMDRIRFEERQFSTESTESSQSTPQTTIPPPVPPPQIIQREYASGLFEPFSIQFSYRLGRFVRNSATSWPGFDQLNVSIVPCGHQNTSRICDHD